MSKMTEFYKPAAYGLLNIVSVLSICHKFVLNARLRVFCT